MKKLTFVIMALLMLTFTVKAQQYVSTLPANRNVILEEFTGRNCGYCPDGHLIANTIMANNPGRVWAINVHAGGYAPTSYPNFITPDGNTIHGGFSISGYPTGVVNRSTPAGQGRNVWNDLTNTQLNQAAECNVAGVATINPDTRVASITVEVYYTANSTVDENFLTVAMLQDSIMGSQSGMTGNPSQVVNGTYCHMHILRDVITQSAWGDAISPTTQGTLITRTYEYQIPESIGSPNGVAVDLNNIFFLAWVAERQQGNAYRPILTGCELLKTNMTNEPIYPMVKELAQQINANCSLDKNFSFNLFNIGTEALTSVKFHAQIGNVVKDIDWTGELPSGENTKMAFDMEIPVGTYMGTFSITEANGQPFESTSQFEVESLEWAELMVEGETTNVKLYIIQDQWGEQITWDLTNSSGEIVAQGGPYGHLIGSGATQPIVVNINNLDVNECYLFRIYDSNDNGICCDYGYGYYYFKDANGNRFIEAEGDYGSEGRSMFSIKGTTAVEDVIGEELKVYPNPANDYLVVEGIEMTSVEVLNALGQRLISKTVNGNSTNISLSGVANGTYYIRVKSADKETTVKFNVNR